MEGITGIKQYKYFQGLHAQFSAKKSQGLEMGKEIKEWKSEKKTIWGKYNFWHNLTLFKP